MRSSYNFSTSTDYLSRKMFLDDAGQVSVQRFEEVKYPKIQKFEEVARSFYWVPEEITLTKDKIDFKESTDAIKHIFTSNLLRQTALDSIQGRAPSQIFIPVISIPELEALVLNWGFFETNIHSKSYSHIIRNIYNVPKDEFNKIHDTQEIISMASNVGKYYDDLYLLNCRKDLFNDVNLYEHKKAIWLALNASYALEAIRFMVSFATSLGMVENKIFIGNGNIIRLILQDELLHTEWTKYIINTVVTDDPDFEQLKNECAEEVYNMYLSVIEEEKQWASYLFKKGVVIGLNAHILIEFVDYMAFNKLKDIGIKYHVDNIKNSPIPWFGKYLSNKSSQTALQESESISYVIGAMSDTIDYDELPEL